MREELLLIPGPTMLSSRVLSVMSLPQLGHLDPWFVRTYSEALELTKYLFQSREGLPYILTGSGTLMMEAVVVSLLEPDDKVLVVDTGHFGERFGTIAAIHGAKVEVVKPDFGKSPTVGEIDMKLSHGNYKALFVTHVDTATGVVNSVADMASVAKKYGVLSVVDSVCGVGGIELLFDKWELDVALTGSQKAIAAPPGLSLAVVSKKAFGVMNNRKTPIRSYYMDLTRWRRVMDNPSVYVATPAVNLIVALREALVELKEEGLERRLLRHKVIADGIRAGIEALDFKIVAEPRCRANTVTAFYVPDKKVGELHSRLKGQFNIQLAKGLYEYRDLMLRIGHFGSISVNDAVSFVAALEVASNDLSLTSRRGAVDEALKYLKKLKP
ncbi:MAG: pyridoxal-phosphate-dependent aminotransferase family protein [Nitrososphaeria archaeon]